MLLMFYWNSLLCSSNLLEKFHHYQSLSCNIFLVLSILLARCLTIKGIRYVSCPDCHCLYSLADCVVKTSDGHMESKKCSYVRFPLHPQAQHRKACGAQLMKKVKRKCNGTTLYPKRVYCYKSLVESLQDMLKQPEFSKKCELWRSHKTDSGVFSDIYDGAIWKDFLNPDGQPFLSISLCNWTWIGLILINIHNTQRVLFIWAFGICLAKNGFFKKILFSLV